MDNTINVLLPLLSDQEFNTILAALRYYQMQGLADDPSLRPDVIHDIATNYEDNVSLDDIGIDDLCERINTRYKKVTDKNAAEGEYNDTAHVISVAVLWLAIFIFTAYVLAITRSPWSLAILILLGAVRYKGCEEERYE